ncbi:MAG: histidine kinase [Bacteroidota bacterium]|nr:histidine kinase [Bacteroidota bacterium]
MRWPLHHTSEANYWLKVFALYALMEATIQLLFFIVLNNFGSQPVSIIEVHLLMWFFQCLLIWPIWWVAWSVRKKKVIVQVLVNLGFYIIYSYLWFGPVQDAIGYLYDNLLEITRPENKRLPAILDQGDQYAYLNYQLIKHAFRLLWFYLAAYFYNYRLAEKERLQLAIANKELQLKMLKWHLNPSFYFKTIQHLRKVADDKPVNATGPILQLAKVMEYVIYEAKEKLIAVKKEIQFLSNYIQLKNQQLGNCSNIDMEVTGEHEKLKIAPLLLTGIIDKIVTEQPVAGKADFRMLLQFSGNDMELIVTADTNPGNLGFIPDDAMQTRLKELYPEKYIMSYSADEGQFKLNIKLDAER